MKNNILHRRDRLIITTIEIIDKLGIQGLSTREIAKREGVSEATLFRHYESKNDLLLAVLDFYSKFDKDIYYSTKLKKLSIKESIRYYISASLEYYENYPEITAISQIMDVLRYDDKLRDKVIEINNNEFKYIESIIAKESKGENLRIDSNTFSIIILGVMREICLRWRISERNFSLKETALTTIGDLLDIYIQDEF